MGLLLLVSIPFAALGAWSGRARTIAVPFLFWLFFAWLESLGVLPGTTSTSAALLAGAIGAVFTGLGVLLHSRVHPRVI